MTKTFFISLAPFSSILLPVNNFFRNFTYNKLITLIQSLNLLYHIFFFENYPFVTKSEMLDENDIIFAHITPTSSTPDIVQLDWTVKPAVPV